MSRLVVNQTTDATRAELEERVRNLTFNLTVYHFWYGELPDGLVEDAAARFFALMEGAAGDARPSEVMQEAIQAAIRERVSQESELE